MVSSHELKCLCAVRMWVGWMVISSWSKLLPFFRALFSVSKKGVHVLLLSDMYQLTAFSSGGLGFCGTNPRLRPSLSYCKNIAKSEISKPPTMSLKQILGG